MTEPEARTLRTTAAAEVETARDQLFDALRNWRTLASQHADSVSDPSRADVLRDDRHLFRAIVGGLRSVLYSATSIETSLPLTLDSVDLAIENARQIERALS